MAALAVGCVQAACRAVSSSASGRSVGVYGSVQRAFRTETLALTASEGVLPGQREAAIVADETPTMYEAVVGIASTDDESQWRGEFRRGRSPQVLEVGRLTPRVREIAVERRTQ